MTKEYSWMLGPFEKAAEANPCLVPNAVSRFFCPVQEKELGWEAKVRLLAGGIILMLRDCKKIRKKRKLVDN